MVALWVELTGNVADSVARRILLELICPEHPHRNNTPPPNNAISEINLEVFTVISKDPINLDSLTGEMVKDII